MSIDDMDRIAAGLGRIAATHGILLQTCGTDIDWSRYGIRPSGCMTLEMLGSANGITFKPRKHKGQRSGCHCYRKPRHRRLRQLPRTAAATAMRTKAPSARSKTTAKRTTQTPRCSLAICAKTTS